MSEEIEVTINVTGEEAVKILNAKEQEITYLKNEIARLSQQTQHSEPQLTIPKSIADLLDKFIEFYFDDVGHEDWWIQENGLIEWFSKTPNCYIKDAYLAGKALGVDLVKVVEG
ncbi:hypothetical protein RCG51_10120 [Lactococcus lactis]|uniref:hypothetical protein n=1 Tax=Lactococcus lactis TaxID=1358 RepID=UPI00280C03AD|nr:hypothetical protein [Lactococcus lactis]WMM20148.1 hypothetical protein RCG38_01160 [Lactococcus lactis]WMM21946.1 hypothetical protein RCG51_10120 [Lactococcus lactis]